MDEAQQRAAAELGRRIGAEEEKVIVSAAGQMAALRIKHKNEERAIFMQIQGERRAARELDAASAAANAEKAARKAKKAK